MSQRIATFIEQCIETVHQLTDTLLLAFECFNEPLLFLGLRQALLLNGKFLGVLDLDAARAAQRRDGRVHRLHRAAGQVGDVLGPRLTVPGGPRAPAAHHRPQQHRRQPRDEHGSHVHEQLTHAADTPGIQVHHAAERRSAPPPPGTYRGTVTPDGARAHLEHLRAAVAGEVQGLEADLRAVFEASQDSNADDEHDPEGSTIAYERAQLTAVLTATRRRLADLDDALTRLDAGTYGTCERCGRPIPPERLAVRPFARTCVTCT